MKTLIINYNRLTFSKNLANWCADHGLEPIFIDNNSDYPPLLEYYKKTPFTVVRLNENFGSHVVWKADILKRLGIGKYYIVTDPDLNMNEIPDDFLEVLHEGLRRYPKYSKCGLSLEINDLPDSKEGRLVKNKVEYKYWKYPLDPLYFRAPVATTFALYHVPYYSLGAIRTNRPYTIRHLPWYITKFSELSDEEKNYWNTAKGANSGWSSGKDRILNY